MVPHVPLIPSLSIICNIVLMSNLNLLTWIRFLIWMVIGKQNRQKSPFEPDRFKVFVYRAKNNCTVLVRNSFQGKRISGTSSFLYRTEVGITLPFENKKTTSWKDFLFLKNANENVSFFCL